MSAHPDWCDKRGLLVDSGIVVYECMTGPGKAEVKDLCEQLRRRLARNAELEAALLKIASGVPVVGPATTRGLSVLDMASIASKALKKE